MASLLITCAGGPISAAQTPVQPDHPLLHDLSSQVRAERLRSTVQTLVGFGTRHTLSDTASTTRGVGAAQRWTKSQFDAIGQACGGCLEIITPAETVTGKRIPTPTSVGGVVAVQRGTGDPDRVVLITGHIDSRVTDVMNAVSDAPGANDDASGVAAVIEAARLLSRHKFPATIVYGVLSGEEQGSYGAKALADYARAHGWRIEADLNNDIIGNIHGQSGATVADRVRVFSEGTKAGETADAAAVRHHTGGELDSPSRNVARFIAELAPRYLSGFQAQLVYRTDRYGRGGDQDRFVEAGYPAVRLTEAAENYTRQHQDLRTEGGVRYGDVIEGVDFPYLAQVTRLNIVALAALASAPPPPTDLKIAGAVTPDTVLSWSAAPGAASYRVWWRDTTAAQWDRSREAGPATTLTLAGVNIDDSIFGVSAVSADGYASPVEFPGPSGAFISPPAN
ncbi:MAG: M20/M25/M40 family metallo-hydrolase [Caulobacteraceae bacterium]